MTKEEIEIWNKAKTDINTRNKLICENLNLVKFIAKKYSNRVLEFDDLVNEGVLGLIEAIEKFNPKKGYKFSTYASFWIEQRITRAIEDKELMIRIPNTTLQKARKYWKFIYLHELLTGEKPSKEELLKELKVSEERLKEIINAPLETESLNDTIKDSDDELLQFIEDVGLPLDSNIIRESEYEELHELLNCLKENEREVLKYRYGFYGKVYTQNETKDFFNITGSRIGQIENVALRKLKGLYKFKSLQAHFQENQHSLKISK